jgi:phosphate transport system substrate-binding protein
MALVVHPDNPTAAVALDALPGLFRGEIVDWSDLTARRRGTGPRLPAPSGAPPRPVRPLVGRVYADDRQAVDELVGGAASDPEGRRFARATRYYEAAEEIIATVALDPGAFGLTSRVLVTEKVRALPLLVAGERRVPSVAAIQDGSYPLRRPIYLISLSPPPGAAGDFLRFVVSPRGRGIVERWGFVPPADGQAAAAGLGGCASCAPPRPQVFRITFSRQATAVPEAAKRKLARLAGVVAGTGQRLLVIGHSDPRDGLREAVRDSRERARNVLQFLEENEIPPSQVEVRIAGAEAPIDTNRTSRGRRRNRRVDVFVIQPGN